MTDTRRIRRRTLRRLDEAIGALGHVGDADPASAAEATHRVRTRCKETRALLRLLMPADGGRRERIDALVDRAGESLGTARDAQVLADTLASLPAPLRIDARAAGAGRPDTTEAERLLHEAREAVARRRARRRTGPVLDGLTASYRLARRRLRDVRNDPSDDGVHDLRKAVKRLTYQVRAVRRWAPGTLRPYAKRLDHLGSLLGEDHDLSNAIVHLERTGTPEGSAAASAVQAARARQRVLRTEAVTLGRELLAERPAAFRTRLRAYARPD